MITKFAEHQTEKEQTGKKWPAAVLASAALGTSALGGRALLRRLNRHKKGSGSVYNDRMPDMKEMDARWEKLLKQQEENKRDLSDVKDRLEQLVREATSEEHAGTVQGLQRSADLARYLGVPEKEIIHNLKELDDFMTK